MQLPWNPWRTRPASFVLALWVSPTIFGVAPLALAADDPLEEIVVTASLWHTKAADLPASVTVLGRDTLATAGVQHFEDVLGLVPDLNWAAGTSLPRFFQLRGIGEVEQYQGAPNPSVGFLIDDIDFSGVGMPATLYDTQQIEVLRGPQGTTYGANALAGLISVHTADPGKDFELASELTGGNYDTRSLGLVVGDGFADGAAGWRFVAQQYLSDGYRHNAYYDMNSLNGYDEGTVRGKLHWELSDSLKLDLTLMHVNINDGYDAWSIYNSFTTYSNQPGRDAQRSNGVALRLVDTIDGVGELRSVTSAAYSAIEYSFDGDWGNDALWASLSSYVPYDYYQADHRVRRTLAEDLRLVGDPTREIFGRLRWLFGVYALRLTETDQQTFVFDDPDDGAGTTGLASQYGATNVALYGSLEADMGAHSTLSLGLRGERRVAAYSDSSDAATPFPAETNDMLGGNLSWSRLLAEGERVYVTLSRGYKGGGFNIGSGILSEQRSFGPETLWSVETGFKFTRADSPFDLQADIFGMRRENMQVYLSEQLQQNNPLAYVFFTQNAANGENSGVELEAGYRPSPRWRISGSAAGLRTHYLEVGGMFTSLGIEGREQPFAPSYQASGAVEFSDPNGWFARLDSHFQGRFYYYTSDSQSSNAYHLENLRVGYRRGPWEGSFWMRNALNARYAQNGFFFGLIPPNFPNQAFLQQGDPRTVGLTFSYDLARSKER